MKGRGKAHKTRNTKKTRYNRKRKHTGNTPAHEEKVDHFLAANPLLLLLLPPPPSPLLLLLPANEEKVDHFLAAIVVCTHELCRDPFEAGMVR